MLRFYFYSGVEYDQNPKFIKAFYRQKKGVSPHEVKKRPGNHHNK
jgi:hypothetical protein